MYDRVIKVNHALLIPEEEIREFRLFNSLSLLGYWYDRESTLPVIILQEEAISYMNIIKKKIADSLSSYDKRGLAESLYNKVLQRRVASIMPDVVAYAGHLWGVIKVETYGELTEREMEALKMEWQEIAEFGWGEQIMSNPICLEKGELYVGFWDTENNQNLFIKTEEEFNTSIEDSTQV